MTDELKPVAWMYRWRGREPVFLDSKRDWSSNSDWTETPLYTADQLEALQQRVWELEEALERIARLDDYHAPLRPLSAPIIARKALGDTHD